MPVSSSTEAETEKINDLVIHYSKELTTEYLNEKNIHVIAKEVISTGIPGSLWCWVELSPVSSADTRWTDAYYAAVGGGGGRINPATKVPYISPYTPIVIVPEIVNNRMHSVMLAWDVPSKYARLAVLVPVAPAPATAYWEVQARLVHE
jgi:hypothetical protein